MSLNHNEFCVVAITNCASGQDGTIHKTQFDWGSTVKAQCHNIGYFLREKEPVVAGVAHAVRGKSQNYIWIYIFKFITCDLIYSYSYGI